MENLLEEVTMDCAGNVIPKKLLNIITYPSLCNICSKPVFRKNQINHRNCLILFSKLEKAKKKVLDKEYEIFCLKSQHHI